MLPSLVIFLREGIEASMIVSILFASLNHLGRRDRFRDIWIGVGLAILLALGSGVVVYQVVRNYDGSTFQTIFEGCTYLVAVVVLTSMTIWMNRHSRNLKREIESQVATALGTGSGLALALLAFVTVGREGLETAVFTLAIAFNSSAPQLLIGATIGLLLSLALAYWIYSMGRRINYKVFFNVLGVLLLFFAAGLLADAVQNFQALGWLPIGTQHLWNTSWLLSEDSTAGDLLHSFFGYAQSPTLLQVLAYAAFLGLSLWNFLRPHKGRPAVRPAAPAPSAPSIDGNPSSPQLPAVR
jgi:high-affinity iron transporter